MTQVDDLSRSLATFDQNSTLTIAVEMSAASWLVAGVIPGIDRLPVKKLQPDPDGLLRLVERWRAEAVKAGRTIARIAWPMRQAVTDFGWRAGSELAASKRMSSTRRASPYRASTVGPRPTGWTPAC